MDIDLKQLRELMRALRQFDLQELVIEKGDERIKLTRGGVAAPGGTIPMSIAPGPAAGVVVPSVPASSKSPTLAVAEDDANVVFVTSPFVGTFYGSPSPDAAAFVQVGSQIRAGQVLCIVEAMKLMNEIESEVAGTVLEVMAQNGKPVEYGDKLFKVKKS